MESLQIREKKIFETLKKIKNFDFVIIGGYAVNTYTLPRFSVDCDIVSDNKAILKELEKLDYKKIKTRDEPPYHENFIRFEKKLDKGFKANIDIFNNKVTSRETKAGFNKKWIFENSSIKTLRGKTITEKLKLRIINIEALIVMKFISCRTTDIRDIFMLTPNIKDKAWLKEEISQRCNFKDRFDTIKNIITSDKFKDNLQGVYGYIEDKIFEKHKKAVLALQ